MVYQSKKTRGVCVGSLFLFLRLFFFRSRDCFCGIYQQQTTTRRII
jgi:hypothetical protein